MSDSIDCENCKKPIGGHTRDEMLFCRIEILKKIESPLTEEEIISQFNEIKSGEYSRLQSNQQKKID